MSETDDKSQKTFDASEQKLSDLRKKGEIARSADLNAAIALSAISLLLAFKGADFASSGAATLQGLLHAWGAPGGFEAQMSADLVWRIIGLAILPVVSCLALAGIAVLIMLSAQKGIVFAPEKLKPKITRISVVRSVKSKFGPSGLFDFAKSFVKLLIFSTVLAGYFTLNSDGILAAPHSAPGQVVGYLMRQGLSLLYLASVVALCFGVLDLFWQRYHFLNQQKMSRQDVKEEMKRSEGDPEQKAERKRRAREVSQNRMMLDVPRADVIVVNPTHYAVALKWDRNIKGAAPVCVAKGQDLVAARIREIANLNSVPIFSDPPTARALHATVEVGHQIRYEHYQAVAAAIRYSERLNSKAKRKFL